MRKPVLYTILLLLMGASVSMAQVSSFTSLEVGGPDPVIEVDLYPNPAINYINVKLSIDPEISTKPELQIYNVLGNRIKADLTEQSHLSYRISLDNLPTGYYFVSIKIPDTEIHKTYKFLKR